MDCTGQYGVIWSRTILVLHCRNLAWTWSAHLSGVLQASWVVVRSRWLIFGPTTKSANNSLKAHSVQKTAHITAWTIDGHARSSKNVSCGVKRMSSRIDAARGTRQRCYTCCTRTAHHFDDIVLRTMAQKAPHNAIWPVANLPGYHDAAKRLSIQRRKRSWRSAGLVAPTLQVGVCSPNALTIPSLPAPDNTCAPRRLMLQQYGVVRSAWGIVNYVSMPTRFILVDGVTHCSNIVASTDREAAVTTSECPCARSCQNLGSVLCRHLFETAVS